MPLRHLIRTVLFAALFAVSLHTPVSATGASGPWTKEWADQTAATTGAMAVDSANAVHLIYFTNGDTGAARWTVRAGANTWVNPLTGTAWTSTTITDNLTGVIRPSIAVLPNRDVYIAYETTWAGPIAIRKYAYQGANRWAPSGSPVLIPNAAGYWPHVHIAPNGAIGVAWHGGHDDVQTFAPGIAICQSGDIHSTWNTLVSWNAADDFAFDNLGNIHLISNGDYGSAGDPYAGLFQDYEYRKYNQSLQVIAGPIPITDTASFGYRTARIFDHTIAVDGNTVYMVFRIDASYRNGSGMWLWKLTNGVKSGPFDLAAGLGLVVSGAYVTSSNGYVAVAYLAGPSGQNAAGYFLDLTRDLRSAALDPGIRTTNVSGIVDSSGNCYMNARVADTNIGGVRFGTIPGPQSAGSLAGVVRDGAGALVGQVTVSLNGAGGYVRSVDTTPDGAYSIGAVLPGSYSVTASKSGYTSQTFNPVSISAGVATTLDFTLSVQGAITGHVRDAGGAPLPGVTVSTTGSGSYTTASLADGSYILPAVAFGSYAVSAYKFGYLKLTRPAQVSPSESPVVDFQLDWLRVGDVRQLADGATVEALGKVVTGVFTSDGALYISEPDRSAGIRVQAGGLSGLGLAPGQRVDVLGTAATRVLSNHPAERYIAASTLTKRSDLPSVPLVPLAMNGAALGGEALGLAPGVEGGLGLNSIGQLVSYTGRVTSLISTTMFVDDGSGIIDPNGSFGVLVKCPAMITGIVPGDTVQVTGVLEGSIASGAQTNRRQIRVRSFAGDVHILAH